MVHYNYSRQPIGLQNYHRGIFLLKAASVLNFTGRKKFTALRAALAWSAH
jgi:hypothetical protein